METKKKIFLPKIISYKNKNIEFFHYEKQTLLKKNQFNIFEPNHYCSFPIENIDIIFVPLTAFDSRGNRLGTGGGFYDKILKTWTKNENATIGLAYDFQKVKKISTELWDIPISTVITPSKIWIF